MSLLTNLSATVLQANQGYVNLPDPRPLYPSFAQRQGALYSSELNVYGVAASVALSFEGQTMAHVYQTSDDTFQVTFYWREQDGTYIPVQTIVPQPQVYGGDPLKVELSADGNVCVVGNSEAGVDEPVGSIYIYRKVSTGISPSQFEFVDVAGRITGSPFSDFGCSLAISQLPQQQDYTIAVGATHLNDAEGTVGEVFLLHLVIRTPNDIYLTNTQILSISYDFEAFGFSVALNAKGTMLAVGDPLYNEQSGAVWLFQKDPVTGSFDQLGDIVQPTGLYGASRVGFSVSLSGSGTTLSVGAPTNRSNQGSVIVYYIDPVAAIVDQGPTISPLLAADVTTDTFVGGIGVSQRLSADGNTLAIGSSTQDESSSMWIYNRLTRAQWLPNGVQRFGVDQDTQVAAYATGNQVALSGNGQVAAAIGLMPIEETFVFFFAGTVFVFA